MLTSLQYSIQRQTVQADVRRFKQRSASRDLHGHAGKTGGNYNQTDFCVVQGLYMSVHCNTLLPVLKLYVLLRVEGWATNEKPTTKINNKQYKKFL